jgi:hypothetical protein
MGHAPVSNRGIAPDGVKIESAKDILAGAVMVPGHSIHLVSLNFLRILLAVVGSFTV